jgi:hypothetical protein
LFGYNKLSFFIFFKREAAALTELDLIVLTGIITVSPIFKLNSVSGIDIFVTGFMVFA